MLGQTWGSWWLGAEGDAVASGADFQLCFFIRAHFLDDNGAMRLSQGLSVEGQRHNGP